MVEIDILERENRDKSLKIVELQNTIRKQSGQLRQKDQKIQSLQTLLRERTQKINKMNVEFFKMEEQLIEYRKMKDTFVEQENKVCELQQIITLQAEEISNYMNDQQNYIRFIEQLYRSNQEWFQERGLLYEYRGELQRQIEQVEMINQTLIGRNQQCDNELQNQNQQGNDLLGQIQYMIECCEGVE